MGAVVAANASQSLYPPGLFVNVTVMLAPTATVVALTVSAGLGVCPWPIVNVKGEEVPPPGAGVKTVTNAEPAEATSAAVIDARSCVELRKVVARSTPFHRTMEDETKLLPFTVRLKAGDPGVTEAGESEVATGAGFDAPEPTITVGLVAARV